MRLRKILFCLLLVFVALLFLGMTSSNAAVDEASLIKKIAPDGENAIFKATKPTNPEFCDYYLINIVNNMLDEEDYTTYVSLVDGDITKCNIDIMDKDWNLCDSYVINVTWDEPKENNEIKSFISKLENYTPDEVEKWFKVTDLGLINYYKTSVRSELWNIGAASRAIKYSDEVIKLANGGNISFRLEVGMGEQGDNMMYENAYGEMTVFYNGYAFQCKEQGIHLKRVIYIPEDTEDTKEAYIAAAQKRIDDYLGRDNNVIVRYGGTLDSLDESKDEYEDVTVSRNITDGNYYNITIDGKTYRFYIIKGNKEDLVEPTYLGSDIDTNIKITSDDSSIPLDTSLSVKQLKNEEIEKIVGNNNYGAFDINLYSTANKSSVTKLENGKFLVSIPVEESLNSKDFTVYYLNDDNELEDYDGVVEEGIASFETNHFSTYIIAKKKDETQSVPGTSVDTIPELETEVETPKDEEKDNTPPTGNVDVLGYVLAITLISALGIIVLKVKETK